MSETRFTPAPWEWWTSNSWRRLRHEVRGVGQNVLLPHVCRDGQADIDVSPADMALIAAAPDLYEAAADAEDAIASLTVRLADCEPGVSAQEAYDSFYTGNLKEALEALRAAMSKALGNPSNKPTKSETAP